MTSSIANCLVAQSGGPTSVINASLSGVIEAAIENKNINKIYGALNGIEGVLNNNIIELNTLFLDKNHLNSLKTTPSTFLGSCRYKLENVTSNSNEYNSIFNFFNKYNIKCFFYIGGNDSMDTVDKLNTYAQKNNYDISVIGIPKTIDNDLVGTDHTPGFGSAAKFVATTLLEVTHDAYCYNTNSVTIVEIMGRNAGWLTASSALARNTYNEAPDLIYLPEVPFSIEQFISDVKGLQKIKKNVIIAVSEGIKDKNNQYISATTTSKDQFGHAKLSGTGKTLGSIVQNKINCKVRSIELNVLQRSAVHIASLTDTNEAYLLGKQAVEYAQNGVSGEMLSLKRTSNSPYTIEITTTPIDQIANKEKSIPRDLINKRGNNIHQGLIDYMSPLIYGEVEIHYKNGLPEYLSIEHLIK